MKKSRFPFPLITECLIGLAIVGAGVGYVLLAKTREQYVVHPKSEGKSTHFITAPPYTVSRVARTGEQRMELPPPEIVTRTTAFGSRNPEVKKLLLEMNGGDDKTEGAVARGFKWLGSVQAEDGSWSGKEHGGAAGIESACTGLALLALLGAGHIPDEGEFGEVLRKGIQYLLKVQNKETGMFPGNLYCQGIATMALVEAYGMTADYSLKDASQKAVDYIVAAQQPSGGWDYTPFDQKRVGEYPETKPSSTQQHQFLLLQFPQMLGGGLGGPHDMPGMPGPPNPGAPPGGHPMPPDGQPQPQPPAPSPPSKKPRVNKLHPKDFEDRGYKLPYPEALQMLADDDVLANPDTRFVFPKGIRNDTSVTGWQMMALKSAKVSGLFVPDETYQKATWWFDYATDPKAGSVGYGGRGGGAATSGVGLMCRLFMGQSRKLPVCDKTADFIGRYQPEWDRSWDEDALKAKVNMYQWYHGTLATFLVGGSRWKKWNESLKQTLLPAQETEGEHAGSWPPVGRHGAAGGRVYSTALAVLMLEVYYRYEAPGLLEPELTPVEMLAAAHEKGIELSDILAGDSRRLETNDIELSYDFTAVDQSRDWAYANRQVAKIVETGLQLKAGSWLWHRAQYRGPIEVTVEVELPKKVDHRDFMIAVCGDGGQLKKAYVFGFSSKAGEGASKKRTYSQTLKALKGGDKSLAELAAVDSKTQAVTAGRTYTLDILRDPTRVELSLDRKALLMYEDLTPLDAGQVGIYLAPKSEAIFRRVTIAGAFDSEWFEGELKKAEQAREQPPEGHGDPDRRPE